MKGKWLPWSALALMLLAFGPALGLRLRVQDMPDVVIAPLWERRVLALAILTALIPAVALLVAAVRRALRLWVVMPLVVLLVLGIAGGGALMTVLTRNFVFPDHYLRTEAVEPEELHLYEGGLLGCTLKVYAAPRGAVFARLVTSANIACADRDEARAHWEGGSVVIEGAGAASSPGFFWGPR